MKTPCGHIKLSLTSSTCGQHTQAILLLSLGRHTDICKMRLLSTRCLCMCSETKHALCSVLAIHTKLVGWQFSAAPSAHTFSLFTHACILHSYRHANRGEHACIADLVYTDIALSEASVLPEGPVNVVGLLTGLLIGLCTQDSYNVSRRSVHCEPVIVISVLADDVKLPMAL